MIKIDDLTSWLPEEVAELYRKDGVLELYPPQADVVERGLLDGKSLVVAIPTAAGKTLLAELAMLRAALKGERALYIVPLRALASEKLVSFSRFEELGVTVGISSGDFEGKEEHLGKNQIVVATSEKADSLIRNETGWIRDLSVLVVDEIHLLNSVNRGPTLEMTITKLMRLNPTMQVLGLSATVANASELADWLGADLVQSEWRPVSLKECVVCHGTVYDSKGSSTIKSARDDLSALVRDTLDQDAQMLIFESSRRNAEATAVRLAQTLSGSGEGEKLCQAVLATGESEISKKLAGCVKKGSAFHHAGLLPEQRRLIEEGFRDGKIKVLASTPTLAAGLNLPARRVVIRSYRRYEVGRGMVPIPVMEYRQMAGRAGRPGLDPYGESFLLAKSEPEVMDLMDHYVHGEPEEISSKLAGENALRTHILSTIAAGFATSPEELREFIDTTFYAHQQDTWHLDAALEKTLDFLEESSMITSGLEPTSLGSLVSRLYIDPLSARIVMDNLMDRSRPADLTLIHLITMTPNMDLLYIRSGDGWVEDFVDEHLADLCPEDNYDWMLKEAKTAAMLMSWIYESSENEICERYGVGPGDVRRVTETAEWLMHSTVQLSRHLDLGVTRQSAQLERRLHYGANRDLLALLELTGIGRVRARKLHLAGYTSPESLKEVGESEIGRIVGPKIAEKVMAQLGRG